LEVVVSLEEALIANTAAVDRLAGLMSKGGGGAPAAAAGEAGRGPGRPKKVTLDQVKAVAKKLMDEKGRPVAVKLIQEHGADQLANLEEGKYPAFVAAAEVLLAQGVEEPAGDEL
jgi:hypothetical protein